MSQRFELYPDLTVRRRTSRIYAALAGVSGQSRRARAARPLLDELGLCERAAAVGS
jgi:ABC-type multidrug transport system ATPase subunit